MLTTCLPCANSFKESLLTPFTCFEDAPGFLLLFTVCMIKGNITAKPVFSEPLKSSQESSNKEAMPHALSSLSESLERNLPKL